MPACPSNTELSDFALGKLSERAINAISEHLGECPSCRNAVESLEAATDRLLAAVRNRALHRSALDSPDSEAAELGELAKRADRLGAIVLGSSALPPLDIPSGESPSLLVRIAETEELQSGSQGDESASRRAPQRLGQYLLLEKIGQGAMGAVYRARHTSLKRTVAVKILPQSRMNDEQAVARFRREMEAVGKLDHAHIVRATDAGEADGQCFLVMEHVDGLDLHRLAIACGPLAVPDACELIRQAAVGLAHAHERGLVHRDIKPSNLMLDSQGRVKVLDLGLALLAESYDFGSEASAIGVDDLSIPEAPRTLDGHDDSADPASGSTSPSQILGTREYMPPEQAINSRSVDARGDVYSLGCTLFRLLTGAVPFPRENYDSLLAHLRAVAREPAPSLSIWRPDAPPMLAAVVARMLAKDPLDRFASAAEAAAALAPFCQGADLAWLIAKARYDASTGAAPPLRPIVAEAADHRDLHSSSYVRVPPALPPPPKPGIVIAELSDSNLRRPRHSWKIGAAALVAGALLLGAVCGGPVAFYFFRVEAPTPQTVQRVEAIDERPAIVKTEDAETKSTADGGAWCLRFAGNSRVEIANTNDLIDPRKGPFTVETLFRANQVGTYGTNTLFGFQPDLPPERARRTIGGIELPPHPRIRSGMPRGFGDEIEGWSLALISPIGLSRGMGEVEFHEGSRFGHMGRMPRSGGPFRESQSHPGWHHIALCATGGEPLVFVDGVIKHRQHSIPHHRPPWEEAPTSGKLILGSLGIDPFAHGAIGDVRAFRISSIARYREDFEPLSTLANDESTTCLLDFSAGEGDRLTDKSGHERHGTIVGAAWTKIETN